MPFKAVGRHRKAFRSDVFAECEQGVMTTEVVDCRSYALVDLDLLNTGIAFDIDNAVALQQIVIELLRAANVKNGVRVPVKLANCFQRQSGRGILFQITRTERPTILEIEFPRQTIKNLRGDIELLVKFEGFRVVGKSRRIFDVVNVVPESLQADDVMHVLPDHAGDRHPAHEAHHHDPLAFQNVLTTTAGFPATIVFGAILFVTTAPAATTELSPMTTPFRMTAFIPIQTLSPIFTGAVFNFGRGGRSLKYGASACASINRCAGSSG